ncbi:hypothetical protein SAMN04487846_0812 [Microbacterium sp. cf046]|uniref:hypothetical protein n=1 Tax=Microbacterium sp. cf046 TaxID=1761803 RepID=UPI0008EFE749|nr:hypothetical protein [Microbacterium sp. cf046]SFR93515.1 hypothetical protein SAMN04487846_0812 [Microbacterium sp. cf046]
MADEIPRESLRQPALPQDAVDEDRVVITHEQIGGPPDLRMPEPEVRDSPDAGAIDWHEQIEPGLPAQPADGSPTR